MKRTREEMGLTVDDVAAELHLSHFQIEALETDEWDRLPGTTYARGYLRSYARLLGLDAEQLLSEASTQEIELSRVEPEVAPRKPAEAPAPAPGKKAESPPPEPSSDDGDATAASSRMPWGLILGGVLIAGAAVALLQYGVPRQVTALLENDGADQAAETAPSTATTEAEAAAADEGAGDGAEETAAAPEPIDASGARSYAGDTAGGDRPPTPTEPELVVFEFGERSWVDVRDASGERLLYRDFQSGRRIEIEGRPPFKIFLGNARGVQVEYLGEVIEPETSPGRMYARFVLGAASG